jgi:hypothetical protein
VIRQLLFEHLTGYTGVDVADRGADPEGDATLTMDEMEHLIATWTVGIWQRRKLGEYAPAWDPDGITRRGVKIRGLWYDAPVLDGYRAVASTRGGKHKNQWVIRRDHRDRRSVFFCDPVTHALARTALDRNAVPRAGPGVRRRTGP